MNKRLKSKLSTIFMLIVLFVQSLSPVVTIFAEDVTPKGDESQEVAQSEAQTAESFTENGMPVVFGEETIGYSGESNFKDSVQQTGNTAPLEKGNQGLDREPATSASVETDVDVSGEEAIDEDDEDSERSSIPPLKENTIQKKTMTNLLDFLKAVEFTIELEDGTKLDLKNGDSQTVDPEKIKAAFLNYSFDFGDQVENHLEPGIYTFKLPEILSGTAMPKMEIPTALGSTITIASDGTVSLDFTEAFVEKNERQFELKMSMAVVKELFEELRRQQISIGSEDNKVFEVELVGKDDEYKGKDEKSGKTYVLDKTGEKIATTFNPTHADWIVRVNDRMEQYGTAKIIDTLEGGHTLDETSIKVYRIHRTPKGDEVSRELVTLAPESIISTASGFELDLGTIDDTYEIHYTTEIAPGTPGTIGKIGNQAQIILDGESVVIDTPLDIEWGYEDPLLEKEFKKQNGQYLEWSIKYNFNNDKLGYKLDLSDRLSIGYFDAEHLDFNIQKVIRDAQGKLHYSEIDASLVNVVIDKENPKELSIKFPESEDGAGYYITYQSIIPGGLVNAEITNEVTDQNNPKDNKDSAGTKVTTKPNIQKEQGKFVSIKGQAHIKWTVKVNSPSYAFDSLLVQDRFDSRYLELDASSVRLDDNLVAVKSITEGSQTGFDYEIKPVEAKPYTLTYLTKVTPEGLKQGSFQNNAGISWEGGIGNGSSNTAPGIKPGLTKQGIYAYNKDKTEQVINWTLTFNTNDLILKPATLTDVMTPEDLKIIAGTFEIFEEGSKKPLTENVDYTFEALSDKNGFQVKFEETEAKVYTVKYQTNVPIENIVSSNTATLDWQGNPDTTTSNKLPIRKPEATKSGKFVEEDNGNRVVEWTVRFNQKKHIIKNLKLTDEFAPVESKFVENSLKITEDGQEFTAYKFAMDTDQANKFTVSFDGPTKAAEYVMIYRTTYPKEAEYKDATNKILLEFTGGKEERPAKVTKPELKLEKIGEINKEDKTITWTIEANGGKAVTLQDAVLEDTIQADQAYVPGSMKLNDLPLNDSEAPVSWADKTFTIQLADGREKHTVTYQTKIVTYPSLSKNDVYKNTVTLTNWSEENPETGRQTKDTADAKVAYFEKGGNNTPVKKGEQNEDDSISWEVLINKENLPIQDGEIRDQLSKHHTYDQTSIQLATVGLDGTADTNIDPTEYKLTFGENDDTFTLAFPDRKITQAYILTYNTLLKETEIGNIITTNAIGIYNKTDGVIDEVVTTETKAEKWYFGASGSASALELSGTKVDKDLSDLKLSDVEFKLELVTSKGKTDKGTYTTDQDGKISMKELRSARYILTETKARPGYQGIAPIYFILGRDQDGKTTVTLTDKDWNETNSSTVSVGNEGELTISNEKVKKSFTATKTWAGENEPKLKPIIWFTLYSQSKDSSKEAIKISTKELTGGAHPVTQVTWKNLPTHDDSGEELTYFVKETDADGKDFAPEYYEKEEEGLTVTNTFAQEFTALEVKKIWQDYENKHQTRPEFIYLQVQQDGINYQDVFQLGISKILNQWEHTFTDLPVVNLETGKAHQYTVIEVDKDGNPVDEIPGKSEESIYDVATEIGEDGTTRITNTLRNKTSLSGEKKWLADETVKEITRPSQIKIKLFQNTTELADKELTLSGSVEKNTWEYEFIDLEKYDSEGNLYEYTVEEVDLAGYESAYDKTTIMNTLKTENLSVQKVWEDETDKSSRPSSVTFELLRQVTGVEGVTVVTSHQLEAPKEEASIWHYTFENLPSHDKEGRKFIYSIREVSLPDGSYKASPTRLIEGVQSITNTLIQEDELVVKKVWDDASDTSVRPTAIEVQLYRQVTGQDAEKVGSRRTLTEKDALNSTEWQISYTGLAASDQAGNKYHYYIEEVTKSGSYQAPIIDREGQVTTITNTLETVDIPVEKIWQDTTDISIRPNQILVDLYRTTSDAEEPVLIEGQTLTLSPSNNWQSRFIGLAKEDEKGNLFNYSIKERDVTGYQSKVSGQTITNTLELTQINVVKIWQDDLNHYGLRPEAISLKLMAREGEALIPVEKETILESGETIRTPVEMILTGSSLEEKWAASFDELTKYNQAGDEVDYVVIEERVNGYESQSASILTEVDGEKQVVIINTLLTTTIPITKVWEDQDNLFNTRPKAIEIQLIRSDDLNKIFAETTLTEKSLQTDGVWSYIFVDLPAEDAEGNPYTYEIREVPVTGYDTEINQETGQITNRLMTTEVNISKGWIDFEDKFNLRPSEINVHLLRNGEPIEVVDVAKITPDEAGDWLYTFTDLPKFDSEGQEYIYTIEEEAVPGYASSIVNPLVLLEGAIQFSIVNTLITTEVEGEKLWEDDDNAEGFRPTFITVNLLQNEEEIDSVKVTADEDGEWYFKFEDLPKFDSEGEEYEYTVTEVEEPDYTTYIEGTTIINTLKEGPIKDREPVDPFDPEFPEDIEDVEDTKDPEDLNDPQNPNDPKNPENPNGGKLPDTGGKTPKPGGKIPNTDNNQSGKTSKEPLPQTGETIHPIVATLGISLVTVVVGFWTFRHRRKEN